jgi:starch-binding outer membrane protein, SusD/RagB family
MAIAWALVLSATGCDSLLKVNLPGQLTERELNDPRLSSTLVLGAQGDFECALSSYVWAVGMWTTDFHASNITRTNNIVAVRNVETLNLGDQVGEPQCTSTNPPPLWLPFNVSRFQAESAIARIQSFPESSVPNQNFLLGKAHAYAGYSYQILGESFCELAFDNGPRKSPEETWRIAETHFTQAIEYAGRVTSGADLNEAREIVNMALVGRARARLNLGDGEGVLADASRVPVNFVRLASRSTANSRRWNRVYEQSNRSNGFHASVTERYRNLQVGGISDPRVPLHHVGLGRGIDGVTDVWVQMKYAARGSAIPFSTGREAQLMIAEVKGGQEAVAIINRLRDTHNLPHFSSSDPDEIREQVREERRRELFLQGTRIGDMLRWNEPWATGRNPQGEPYGGFTCIPLPRTETLNNPNLR